MEFGTGTNARRLVIVDGKPVVSRLVEDGQGEFGKILGDLGDCELTGSAAGNEKGSIQYFGKSPDSAEFVVLEVNISGTVTKRSMPYRTEKVDPENGQKKDYHALAVANRGKVSIALHKR